MRSTPLSLTALGAAVALTALSALPAAAASEDAVGPSGVLTVESYEQPSGTIPEDYVFDPAALVPYPDTATGTPFTPPQVAARLSDGQSEEFEIVLPTFPAELTAGTTYTQGPNVVGQTWAPYVQGLFDVNAQGDRNYPPVVMQYAIWYLTSGFVLDADAEPAAVRTYVADLVDTLLEQGPSNALAVGPTIAIDTDGVQPGSLLGPLILAVDTPDEAQRIATLSSPDARLFSDAAGTTEIPDGTEWPADRPFWVAVNGEEGTVTAEASFAPVEGTYYTSGDLDLVPLVAVRGLNNQDPRLPAQVTVTVPKPTPPAPSPTPSPSPTTAPTAAPAVTPAGGAGHGKLAETGIDGGALGAAAAVLLAVGALGLIARRRTRAS